MFALVGTTETESLDGVVRLMLAILAADIIAKLSYVVAINVNLLNQCCEPPP